MTQSPEIARPRDLHPDILCIGSVLWDIIGHCDAEVQLGADLPGRITRVPGGVAMNIAMALARLGLRPALLSAVGRDAEGDDLIAAARQKGLITDYLHRDALQPTDRYMAIEGANGLIAAIADAHALEAAGATILAALTDGRLGTAARPWTGLAALDGNLTAAVLADLAVSPVLGAADLRVAPASPGKADRLRPLLSRTNVTLYVNLAEARVLTGTASQTATAAANALLDHGAVRVLVTDGPRACAFAQRGLRGITATPPAVRVARVTGAGDTFMAAHIAAERQGLAPQPALNAAMLAAAEYIGKAIGT